MEYDYNKNNAEIVLHLKNNITLVALLITQNISKDEEICVPYGPDYWT